MSTQITIVGRLGRDPELRFSGNGNAVTNLSIVSSRRQKNGDTWVDADTTWWNVTAFKRLAENTAESLTKGNLVVVVGRIRQRDWETPEGEKRSRLEVIADHIAPSLEWDPVTIRKADRPTTTLGTLAGAAEDDPWASDTASTGQEPPF